MAESLCYSHGDRQQPMHSKDIAGARREGGPPPLPSWKLYKNPFYDGLAAAVVAAASAAAAVAMSTEHHDDLDSLGDGDDECTQEFPAGASAAMARRPSATSLPLPACRVVTTTTHYQDKLENGKGNANWAFHQGFKAPTSMAMASRSSAPSMRRGPVAMAGGAFLVSDQDTTHRSTEVYEKEEIVYGLGGCRGPRDSMAMAGKASAGMTQDFCEARNSNGEEGSMPPSYAIILPRTCEDAPPLSSPRSHLQPRPPSSTSDSPCSSKPIKASKVSTRSAYPNKSPQHTFSNSPPLKAISPMRPKPGGEAVRLRSSALKSASSSQSSPLGRDAVESLVPSMDGQIITSPRDYLKALNRSPGVDGRQMEGSSIIPALSEELKRALTRVQELEHSQISARKEVDGLLKRFADERTLLRTKEQEKIQAAVYALEEELDKERKFRRKLDLENRKLSRSLAEASKAVVKAEKELDKERKARQLMEDVCDELAKEIGEDKAEFEELKREHVRASEEMEEERKTLQMTEAWREERVQMKLADAKFELEERCVALERLTMELDMYLKSRRSQGAEASYESEGEGLRAAVEKLKTETSWSMLLLENSTSHAPHPQDDTVSSDDLHSLRLSRDNVRSHAEWDIYLSECERDRAKWVIDSSAYVQEASGQASTVDANPRDESTRNGNVYTDVHDGQKQPLPRWGKEVGLASRPTNFENSDTGDDGNSDDGDNEVYSNGAGSTWAIAGEDVYGNLDEARWSADGEDDIRAWRQGTNPSGSASEEEKESVESFSPESSTRGYEQGKQGLGAGLYGDHRGYGAQGMPIGREQSLFVGARRNADCENGLSTAVGSLPPVYKLNRAVAPAFRSASQGRRASAVESSAPQGRTDLVEWVRPFKSNSLRAKLLLDDEINGLHTQANYTKGARLRG